MKIVFHSTHELSDLNHMSHSIHQKQFDITEFHCYRIVHTCSKPPLYWKQAKGPGQMTPRYALGQNVTTVFRALADLFVVHEIPTTRLASAGVIAARSVVTLVGANTRWRRGPAEEPDGASRPRRRSQAATLGPAKARRWRRCVPTEAWPSRVAWWWSVMAVRGRAPGGASQHRGRVLGGRTDPASSI